MGHAARALAGWMMVATVSGGAASASASDLWRIGGPAGNSTFSYADAATIFVRPDGQRSVWLTNVFEGDELAKSTYKVLALLAYFDCKGQRSRFATLVEYRADGSVLYDSDTEAHPVGYWSSERAGTIGGMELRFACGGPELWKADHKDFEHIGDTSASADADRRQSSPHGE